ncbi:N-glycosylase/DNA lyase OGG1 [Diospyros lotus]|uniref:N-glycosylase/DNA lyase OGG1 n=1 Tax=Diospyros lotus TaxID=55363 RepID=UPI002258AFF1|nr:N-glycosylase/DNA lyase OGG1 [Diospyros lotus]
MQSLRTSPIMKRKSTSIATATTAVPPTPSTPPTPQISQRTLHPKPLTLSSQKPRKILFPNRFNPQTPKWVPLNLGKSELSLPLTFPTGQTFRWKKTGDQMYTGVVASHLVSLKHLQNGDVAYCFHNAACEADARLALLDFLNVGICLADLWQEFSASDSRFAELASHLGGARVLRQDPLECLIQFLCSSNNNIGRITRMVDFVSSLGNHLGTVEGFEFHEFPSLDRLSKVSEQELRDAGFGYRAKYIIGTVDALQSKPGGGANWLASLRELDLQEVIGSLSTLPGVGPKVAACIALFSLDQHQAIPVDTHVWQIATSYLIPELAGVRLTPKLCNRVADAFVRKYGKYAGWAQTLLFIAELPSQKALLPSINWITEGQKSIKPKVGRPKGSSLNIGKEEAYEKI